MKNTVNIVIPVVLALMSFPLNAQNDREVKDSIRRARMEELKEVRHRMFVEKLGLSETEEKAFFPIYDEYQLKLRESRHEFKRKWKDKKPEDLTEEEASEYINDAVAMRQKEVELFKTYSEKLKTVIPAKKVVILPRVEREIQHELMEKYKRGKGKHQQGKPRQGHPPKSPDAPDHN